MKSNTKRFKRAFIFVMTICLLLSSSSLVDATEAPSSQNMNLSQNYLKTLDIEKHVLNKINQEDLNYLVDIIK